VKVTEGHEGSEFDRMCSKKFNDSKSSDEIKKTSTNETKIQSTKTTTSNKEFKLKCKAYAKDVDKKGSKS
jgi:hypothetical protein